MCKKHLVLSCFFFLSTLRISVATFICTWPCEYPLQRCRLPQEDRLLQLSLPRHILLLFLCSGNAVFPVSVRIRSRNVLHAALIYPRLYSRGGTISLSFVFSLSLFLREI